MRARTRANTRLLETEKGLMDAILNVARMTGWLAYHTFDSRRSAPGFPDLVLVRSPELLIVEVKTNTGQLTKAQGQWLAALGHCPGVETHVWRPRQWETIIERLARRGS